MVDFGNPEIRATWVGDRLRLEAQNGRTLPIENDLDPHDPEAVEILLRALCDTSPKVAEAVRTAIAAAKAERQRYRVVPFGEWSALPEAPYVVAGLLRRGEVALLWGRPGCKKTFLCVDMAARVALGRELWGRYVTLPGPVVYATSEGLNGLRNRVLGWLGNSTTDAVTVSKSMFIVDRVPRLTEPGHVREFVQVVRDACGSPAMVVLDTFSAARGGADENDNAAMQLMMDAAGELARDLGCAVLCVHHGRKAGDAIRGGSAIEGAADLIAKVEKTGDGARLSFEKLKDFRDPGSMLFSFDEIDLGIDEMHPNKERKTTLRVSTVVASNAANTDPIGPDGKPLNGRQVAALRLLQTAAGDGGTMSEIARSIAQEIGSRPADRTLRRDVGELVERGLAGSDGDKRTRRYVITRAAEEWLHRSGLDG